MDEKQIVSDVVFLGESLRALLRQDDVPGKQEPNGKEFPLRN